MELGQTGTRTVPSLRVCALVERSRQRASGNCRWSSPNFLPERKSRNEGKRRTLISQVRRGAPQSPPTSPSREPRAYLAGLFFRNFRATSSAFISAREPRRLRNSLFLLLSFIQLYEKRQHFVRQIL